VRRLDAALEQGKAQAEGGAKSPHSPRRLRRTLFTGYFRSSEGSAFFMGDPSTGFGRMDAVGGEQRQGGFTDGVE
jgi:hypothetical protein